MGSFDTNRIRTVLAALACVLLLAGCASRGSNQGAANGSRTASEGGSDAPKTTVTVAVQKVIPFAEEAEVREPVRKQCDLQTKTPAFIQKFGPENGVNVELVDDLNAANAARRLHLEIVNVHAGPGGGFAGGMWMQVEGRLTENGRTIATVQNRRVTTGGYFSQFKGTCDIIGRCTEAIGRDLAGWLADPEDGAKLGNL